MTTIIGVAGDHVTNKDHKLVDRGQYNERRVMHIQNVHINHITGAGSPGEQRTLIFEDKGDSTTTADTTSTITTTAAAATTTTTTTTNNNNNTVAATVAVAMYEPEKQVDKSSKTTRGFFCTHQEDPRSRLRDMQI